MFDIICGLFAAFIMQIIIKFYKEYRQNGIYIFYIDYRYRIKRET